MFCIVVDDDDEFRLRFVISLGPAHAWKDYVGYKYIGNPFEVSKLASRDEKHV